MTASAPEPQRGPLVDRYGRVHRDLRISVTDRCSLRCTYCMPEDGVPWLPRLTMLTTPEVVRLGGADRYRTASHVAQEFFPTPTNEAFLATGMDFPDALAAAPAAAMNGGPVLLTRPASLPSATVTALDAIRAQTITLVGGFGAISLEVQETLERHVYP